MSDQPITRATHETHETHETRETHETHENQENQAPQEPMTKARLLNRMRGDRARWEAAIDALAVAGAGLLERTGFAGVWSARDVIAHVTAYERWILDALEAWERGEEEPPSILDGDDMDARNMAEHARTRDLPLAVVLADARRVWERLVALVATIPEEVVVEVERAPGFVRRHWGPETPLWEGVWALGGEHYDEHLPDFAAAISAATTASRAL